MPVQLDGSRHAWLEDQGPKFVLLLAVDDAPGTRGETEIGAYVIAAVWRRPRHARGNRDRGLRYRRRLATPPARAGKPFPRGRNLRIQRTPPARAGKPLRPQASE